MNKVIEGIKWAIDYFDMDPGIWGALELLLFAVGFIVFWYLVISSIVKKIYYGNKIKTIKVGNTYINKNHFEEGVIYTVKVVEIDPYKSWIRAESDYFEENPKTMLLRKFVDLYVN